MLPYLALKIAWGPTGAGLCSSRLLIGLTTVILLAERQAVIRTRVS
jgi:hypothetical protein